MNSSSRISFHKLPVCRATGLDRYRDRHQARHGAKALAALNRAVKVSTFACPGCRGFHLETLRRHSPQRSEQATMSMVPPTRRYVVVDIENLVEGQATRSEAQSLWRLLAQEAPRITPADHVVVGGNRYVAKKFSTAIAGKNIKWVVGAVGPDGADRALLAATNVHQVAKRYDELVIMSGDHAFTDMALLARRLGIRVHIVTTTSTVHQSSLSRQLAAAADLCTTVVVDRTNPRITSTAQTPAA